MLYYHWVWRLVGKETASCVRPCYLASYAECAASLKKLEWKLWHFTQLPFSELHAISTPFHSLRRECVHFLILFSEEGQGGNTRGLQERTQGTTWTQKKKKSCQPKTRKWLRFCHAVSVLSHIFHLFNQKQLLQHMSSWNWLNNAGCEGPDVFRNSLLTHAPYGSWFSELNALAWLEIPSLV